MSGTPLIGVSPEAVDSLEPLTPEACYVVKGLYCDAIREAGGAALALPHDIGLLDACLDRVDGVLVTGGAYLFPHARIIDPENEGEVPEEKRRRAQFELALSRNAVDRDLPFLGICGGAQILNAAMGGTLAVRIAGDGPDSIDHGQRGPLRKPSHPVRIVEGTRLHDVVSRREQWVNSAHRQAVQDIPPDAIANAIAPDGVVEGIEAPGRRFCVGVQWHPEYLLCEGDRRLFRAFIAACRPTSGAGR